MKEVRPDRSVRSHLQKEPPRGDDIPALDRPKLSTEIVLSNGDGSKICNQGRKAISDWVATLFIHMRVENCESAMHYSKQRRKLKKAPNKGTS